MTSKLISKHTVLEDAGFAHIAGKTLNYLMLFFSIVKINDTFYSAVINEKNILLDSLSFVFHFRCIII